MTELEEKQADCLYCKDHAPALLTDTANSEFEVVIANEPDDEPLTIVVGEMTDTGRHRKLGVEK